MIERFQGDRGKRVLIEVLLEQRAVKGKQDLAEELANICEVFEIKENSVLIEQDAEDNDIYFILSGAFRIVVNGRKTVGTRFSGQHVGEMAAIDATLRRSATVIANETSVVAKVTEPQLSALGERYPSIYLSIAKELARRLNSRNSLIGSRRDKIKVFIISSTESLQIAREVKAHFEHDNDIFVEIWTEGTFKIANYTIDDLTQKVEESDFAVAIAHADDIVTSRGQNWPIPRDNVTLELGLFMGKLGRERAVLMEPREEKLKLPSDMAGILTITYPTPCAGETWASALGTACHKLRSHIRALGVNE